MGNVIPCGGSRQPTSASTTATAAGGNGPRSLWTNANLSGPSSSASQLPDFNGRQNSKGEAVEAMMTGKHGLSSTVTTSYGCRTSSFVGLRTAPHHPEHQLRMRRPPKLKCLLGVAKQSHAATAIKWACERLGVEVNGAMTLTCEAILNGWTVANREGQAPHIMILDCRAHKHLDVESIARSVRHGVHGDHVVLIGIVKKSVMEREELVVETYLQAGFNRVLIDSGSRGYWLNELAMIIHSDVEASLRLRCAGLLLTALDNCRDIVQVTDSQDRVIYENNSTEKTLGYSSSDWLEKSLWDFQTTVSLTEAVLAENDTTASIRGADLVRQKLDHGKPWEGPLSCRRKAGDNVVLETRIIPVSFSAKRVPDNLVYVRIPPTLLDESSASSAVVMASSSSNVVSASAVHHRRSSKGGAGGGSIVGGSGSAVAIGCLASSSTSKDGANLAPNSSTIHEVNMVRRTSSSKMYHTLTVEAPITKVIHILMSVRESSPLYIAQALDKVLDIIQTNSSIDLFTPELEKERQKRLEDPVTTDLLGALLSHGPKPITTLSRSSSVVYRQSSLVRASNHRRINSTRDALHQRRSSSELTSGTSSSAASAATRSASISVVTSGHHLLHKSNDLNKTPLPPIISARNNDNEGQVRDLLCQAEAWTFDIFALERMTDHRCLSHLGMAIFTRFQLHKTLGCSEVVMQNWLTLIEANYKRSNTYHNSTHAADVLHATAFFLEQESVKEMCDGVDEAVCLIAAVIHDVDHPGKNSAFLCNSGSELANLYNDITVLENHHAAFGFKLTTSDERVNIFQNLDRDSFKLIRQGIIDLVLATDMSKHFIHLNKFVSVFAANSVVSGDEEASDIVKPISSNDIPISPENVAILKRMLIKCADVSNPARPLEICKIWAYRIAEEYFFQTDEEKRLGLPVVMPQFDRATCSIPKSQLGFYDYFIHDMFDVWNGFSDLPQLSEQIRSNYSYWQDVANSEVGRRKSNVSHSSS